MTEIIAIYAVTLSVPEGVDPEEYATEWGEETLDSPIGCPPYDVPNLGWYLDHTRDAPKECDCGRSNTLHRCRDCQQRLCQDCEPIHVCAP